MKNKVVLTENKIDLQKYKERSIRDDNTHMVTYTEPVQQEKNGDHIKEMEVTQYESTTRNSILTVKNQVVKQYDIESIVFIQRIGIIKPKKNVLAIMISAKENREAVDALSFCLDMFEKHVPIQKKLITEDEKEYWIDRADEIIELYGKLAGEI